MLNIDRNDRQCSPFGLPTETNSADTLPGWGSKGDWIIGTRWHFKSHINLWALGFLLHSWRKLRPGAAFCCAGGLSRISLPTIKFIWSKTICRRWEITTSCMDVVELCSAWIHLLLEPLLNSIYLCIYIAAICFYVVYVSLVSWKISDTLLGKISSGIFIANIFRYVLLEIFFITSNSVLYEDFVGYLKAVISGLYLWWLKIMFKQ